MMIESKKNNLEENGNTQNLFTNNINVCLNSYRDVNHDKIMKLKNSNLDITRKCGKQKNKLSSSSGGSSITTTGLLKNNIKQKNKMKFLDTDLSVKPVVSDQHFRTKFCPFLFGSRKECYKGAQCSYAHSFMDLRTRPILTKTKLCDTYMKGKCHDLNCKWAHGRHELRFTSEFYKTSLCKYWEESICYAGDSCRHAHGVSELRVRKTPYKKDDVLKTLTNITSKTTMTSCLSSPSCPSLIRMSTSSLQTNNKRLNDSSNSAENVTKYNINKDKLNNENNKKKINDQDLIINEGQIKNMHLKKSNNLNKQKSSNTMTDNIASKDGLFFLSTVLKSIKSNYKSYIQDNSIEDSNTLEFLRKKKEYISDYEKSYSTTSLQKRFSKQLPVESSIIRSNTVPLVWKSSVTNDVPSFGNNINNNLDEEFYKDKNENSNSCFVTDSKTFTTQDSLNQTYLSDFSDDYNDINSYSTSNTKNYFIDKTLLFDLQRNFNKSYNNIFINKNKDFIEDNNNLIMTDIICPNLNKKNELSSVVNILQDNSNYNFINDKIDKKNINYYIKISDKFISDDYRLYDNLSNKTHNEINNDKIKIKKNEEIKLNNKSSKQEKEIFNDSVNRSNSTCYLSGFLSQEMPSMSTTESFRETPIFSSCEDTSDDFSKLCIWGLDEFNNVVSETEKTENYFY